MLLFNLLTLFIVNFPIFSVVVLHNIIIFFIVLQTDMGQLVHWPQSYFAFIFVCLGLSELAKRNYYKYKFIITIIKTILLEQFFLNNPILLSVISLNINGFNEIKIISVFSASRHKSAELGEVQAFDGWNPSLHRMCILKGVTLFQPRNT